MIRNRIRLLSLITIGVAALLLALTGLAAAASPGETGDGVIPPGFTKVTFVHHAGKAPEVIVEHGANGKGPPLPGAGNVCSDPLTNGTDQCNSFIWDGQYWPGAAVTYNVNLANSGNDGGFLAAIQASAQTWEDDTGSVFDFTYGGTTTRKASSLRNKMDNKNDVTWDALDRYQNPIAVTIFWYYTATGVVVEADLVNNKNFPWCSTGAVTCYDVQNIDTHEYGHFLVLGDLYDVSDSALTMYGYGDKGETQKRTLGLGDQLGIRAIYPTPANIPSVTITAPANNSSFASGASINFTGTAADVEDGDLSASINWNSNITGALGIGASITVTLPDGVHTITASATDSGGNTGSASITVTVGTTPTAITVSVSSINYATTGGKSGTLHLLITVALVDNLGNPVANASVSISVSRNGSFYGSGTGTTGTNGTVTFQATSAPCGTYTTTVTNVTATGLTWDGVTPANSFTKC